MRADRVPDASVKTNATVKGSAIDSDADALASETVDMSCGCDCDRFAKRVCTNATTETQLAARENLVCQVALDK